ncbi:GNAT family N-acetyltransferase [Actinoplanes sp. NPDC020271]|uniref:GNAT family N-acetyltransferase n=1 Tax=Actinoplanes sp. NPDC020271 TaxID=3363896 RepID=UPI0037A26E43
MRTWTARPATTTTAVDALTADGRIVTIRPITASDRPAIAALYESADPENLRLRFFARPTAAVLAAEVHRLCRPQSSRFLAMLAYEGTELVGVASCDRDGDSPRGEFALFVADRHHGRGIGTLLLEHLAVRARRHGMTEMTGEVLSGNLDMLRVAHEFGSGSSSRFDHGVVDVTVDTNTGDGDGSVIDERDRVAERASLHAILAPATVAVVGAGHRPGGAGHEAFRALRGYGFTGRVYPVNRSGAPVSGYRACRSLHDLPEAAELLVVAVPPDQVGEVLRDGAATGARAAVILTEMPGPDGRRRRAELLSLARSLDVRLIGPGSLGVLNTHPDVRLDAGLFPLVPSPGELAVAAQSTGFTLALTEYASRADCGLSALVVLGEKADVSGNELVSYFHDDPATAAVALQLTTFGNPTRFARLTRALSRRKPVLAVREGHTPPVVEALFARAGVIRTESPGDLVDAARMLIGRPLPAGHRLAVVTNGGEEGTDPGAPSSAQVLELPVHTSPAEFAAAVESAATSGTADMLLVIVVGTRANPAARILDALGPVTDRHPRLPAAVAVMGVSDPPATVGARRAPVYRFPDQAVRALTHAADYAEWRRTPAVSEAAPADEAPARVRALIEAALAGGFGPQPEARTAEILAAYGIRTGRSGTEPAVRLVAGVVHDPSLGAMILLGHGPAGPPADPILRMTPLTALDAGRMARSLRCAPLSPRSGGDTLAALLLRLSRLAVNHPEVAALELEVLAGPDGTRVTGAELRLGPAGPEPAPALRRLHGPDER